MKDWMDFNGDGEVDSTERFFADEMLCSSREEHIALFGYAGQLESKIGIPRSVLTPMIFVFIRACVHYAMFEDEFYLKSQMELLKRGVSLLMNQDQQQQSHGGNK